MSGPSPIKSTFSQQQWTIASQGETSTFFKVGELGGKKVQIIISGSDQAKLTEVQTTINTFIQMGGDNAVKSIKSLNNSIKFGNPDSDIAIEVKELSSAMVGKPAVERERSQSVPVRKPPEESEKKRTASDSAVGAGAGVVSAAPKHRPPPPMIRVLQDWKGQLDGDNSKIDKKITLKGKPVTITIKVPSGSEVPAEIKNGIDVLLKAQGTDSETILKRLKSHIDLLFLTNPNIEITVT